MTAPEPFLSAYLAVVHRAIVMSRFISWNMQGSLVKRLFSKNAEQVADLQDAIHVVVELLNRWEDCDEPALRENFLKAYDKKWVKSEHDMSLLTIFNEEFERRASEIKSKT